MAEVFLGTSRHDSEIRVAIKVPRTDLDEEIKSIFLREAEAAQRVSGPNVVQVIDWGPEPPFIAFEFVEGRTLAQEIRERQGNQQHWSELELLDMYSQLIKALVAINSEVIHRDIKPENVFISDGVLKVSDFGISKYVGEITRSKTFKGWGTPAYMSPETFHGESVDWRSDQYSLGVVFHELATLDRPFVGTWDDLEQAHLFERPSRVTTVVDGLSERLATMINRMMEKRPDQRFRSWEDVLAEMDEIRKGVSRSPSIPGDPLVGVAAEQIEVIRRRELEAQRLQEERMQQEKWRSNLLEYWAREFFGKIRSRTEQLNVQLGQNAVRFTSNLLKPSASGATPLKLSCDVTFINARLEIWVETVPLESVEFVLWGGTRLTTRRRISCSNLLLAKEPQPYGTWQEIDMRVSSIIQGRHVQPEGEGGRYDILGAERLVLALNAKGLMNQRALKNVMSLVNYDEHPLDFDTLLGTFLAILVEDASV